MTLALELKEAGHSPIILLYSDAKGRYFENNGIQTISLNALESKEPVEKGVTIDSFLEDGIKYNDVMSAESSRRPIVGWPGQRTKTIRDIHKIHKTLSNIIENYKLEKIIIWNGFTGYVANILRLICQQRKIECAFLERGLLKGSLFIDRMGVNGASSLNELTPSIVDSFSLSNEEESFVKNLFNLSTEIDKNVTAKINLNILFPLQVQLDTNIILYCKYRSMRETFLDIYSTLNTKESSFLIRPHPEETVDTLINIPRFDNVKVSSEKSLEHWLDWADLVVTINSTVGLEALIKGKKVISLGQSIYSSAGLTNELSEESVSNGINYPRLTKYLGLLLKSNLLLPNGPFNKSIVSAQLSIDQQNFAQTETSQNLPPAKPQATTAEIHLAFPLNATLDLTYRKNKTPITKDWLIEITSKHIDAKQYEFSTSKKPNKDRYSIKVVNECKSGKPDYKFDKTIDIYGNEVR
jgi:capsular polysaccharide export protein